MLDSVKSVVVCWHNSYYCPLLICYLVGTPLKRYLHTGLGDVTYGHHGECHAGSVDGVMENDRREWLTVRYSNLQVAHSFCIKVSLVGCENWVRWNQAEGCKLGAERGHVA